MNLIMDLLILRTGDGKIELSLLFEENKVIEGKLEEINYT